MLSSRTVTTVRVATFNIRNGRAFDGLDSWPFRRRATIAAIASLDAAIVGLQEAYRCQVRTIVRGLGNRGLEVTPVGSGRSRRRRGEHTPLLLRRDRVTVVEHRTLWYGDDADRPGTVLPGARFPRTATLAVVELVPEGLHLQAVSTHLDSRSPSLRTASAAQLATWLDPALPQIVLGDLNAGPDDPELEPLLAAGLRLVDVTVPGDTAASTAGTYHSFTGSTTGRRIDHILVSRDIEVVAAEVAHPRPGGRLARLPSDHWPVVADLSV